MFLSIIYTIFDSDLNLDVLKKFFHNAENLTNKDVAFAKIAFAVAGSPALSGITSYLASLVTTFVVATANGASFSVFGITFPEIQILFIVSKLFFSCQYPFFIQKMTTKNEMDASYRKRGIHVYF